MESHARRGPVERILPILPTISKALRRHHADLVSPSHSDIDLEAGLSSTLAHYTEKPREWPSPRKSIVKNPRTEKPEAIPPKRPRTLMGLPHELQILVISYLDFGDILRLRRTSLYWRDFATPPLLRTIHGYQGMRTILLQHCRHCLEHCPVDTTRTATIHTDPGYPLSSRCINCVMQSKDGTIRAGRQIKLGNAVDYWACRWCGWPVVHSPATGQPEFHKRCYQVYFFGGVLCWVALGFVQFLLGVVASALVWHYFRGSVFEVVPTGAAFVLSGVCICQVAARNCYAPKYHWALFTEVAVLLCWLFPMHSLARELERSDAGRPTQATMAFVGLSVLFRLINILGDIVLQCGYDRSRHHVPHVHVCRRALNVLMTGLVLWTYPQHVHRRFPRLRGDDSAD